MEVLAGTDQIRVGYHAEPDGLLMWEGSYLSRTSESVFSWAVVTEMTEGLIERGEYKIKLGLQNAPIMAEQLALFDMGGNAPVYEVLESEASNAPFPAREIPQAVIDQALYTGGNELNSAERIAVFYMQERPEAECVAFLCREFGTENGRGIEYEGQKYAVWFMEDGIHLAQGNSVRTGYERTTVSWERASARILELLETGTYLSAAELERAPDKVLREMADALLMSGNRIDSADSNGDNVLHAICQSAGDIAYDIKRTEERIADFSERWYPERDKRETGEKLENLREADKLCFSTAKRILENGQIDPEDKNNIGKTAFDIAMEEGARRIGALLSGQDPETDELSALAGGLNVFQALWYKDMAALDAILRSGVELQTICEDEKLHDFKGKSPLACALSWDNAEAAEILLRSGADPDFRDSEERTAFAVWLKKRKQGSEKKEECLHLLRCLMQCGWHPENPADKEGNTSLSLACREAGYELGNWAVRYLVENGADVNAVNLQGQTPAMNLYGGRFWDGNIPCFAVLPRSYPYGGRCCTEEDADILEVLLEAGADINAKDKWGNTLLHYIAGSSQRGAKEAVGLVMDFGKPDVNAVNNEGKTALDIATEKNDESLVKFLLKYD